MLDGAIHYSKKEELSLLAFSVLEFASLRTRVVLQSAKDSLLSQFNSVATPFEFWCKEPFTSPFF